MDLAPLAARVIRAQEEALRGVADELHDGLIQYLMATQAHLEAFRLAQRAGDAERADRELDKGLNSLRQSVRETRQFMNDLCLPAFDDGGLEGAVDRLLAAEKARAGWEVACLDHNGAGARLDPTVETAVYRVAQEALANARKHADAYRVHVLLRLEPGTDARTSRLVLEIRDWGQGFDPDLDLGDGGGRGLRAMRERVLLLGGEFEVRSTPGQGTRVHAGVPMGETTAGTAGGDPR